MTTWIVSSLIVLTAAVVLAVVLWPRKTGAGNGGHAALEQAEKQQRQVQPLVRDLRARRAQNNFAPLIERALRGGS
jgi:hypothetical protein